MKTHKFAALLLSLFLTLPAAADERPLDKIKAYKKDSGHLIKKEGRAQPPDKIPPGFTPPAAHKPWLMRMMIHDIRRGMFVGLPIIDTDPNRGATYGIMPIWVIQGQDDDRIRHIHAPSITYNDIFKWVPTYRYYFYPTEKSNYLFRASLASTENPDLVGEMEDLDLLGRDIAVNARIMYDVDGSYRFFGLGPFSQQANETNYTKKFFGYYCRLGLPLIQGSRWKWNIAHRLAGTRIAAGAVDSLPDIGRDFPEQTPTHWHQDAALQFFMDYDTRDSAVTTRTGTYAKVMIENAQREFASEYAFTRYGFDLRHFYKHAPDSRFATAGRALLEQVIGDVPFHLLPALGGKTIHRAYGEGRYVDRGMFTATVEERIRVFEIETAGVMTELEIAPFVGVGNVFRQPGKAKAKYLRPVFGGAIRAIARPQVVGSIDFGVGQEGPAIFMDINYSF